MVYTNFSDLYDNELSRYFDDEEEAMKYAAVISGMWLCLFHDYELKAVAS